MPTLSTIFSVVVFILPGFLVYDIYKSFHPHKQKQTSDVLYWSLFYSIIILFLTNLFYKLFFNKEIIFKDFENDLPKFEIIIIIIISFFITFFSILIAKWFIRNIRKLINNSKLSERIKSIILFRRNSETVWKDIFLRKKLPWCMITLKSGKKYIGYIQSVNTDPDSFNHDILLSDADEVDDNYLPVLLKDKDGKKYYPEKFHLYLRLSEIESVIFKEGDL